MELKAIGEVFTAETPQQIFGSGSILGEFWARTILTQNQMSAVTQASNSDDLRCQATKGRLEFMFLLLE